LPIWATLGAAYREWRRMLPALRPLVINAFLIVLAISVLDEFIQPAWRSSSYSARR
jgi:hypothetical protein